MRTCFPRCGNVCVCRWVWRAAEEPRSRGWNKVTVMVLLMEVLLVFPVWPVFFARHLLLIDSLSLHMCLVCLCVRPDHFFHDKCVRALGGCCSPQKTLMWSDRTASGALLWGDPHCGGDPRVWLGVDNNRKKDLKGTKALSVSEASYAPIVLAPLLFFIYPPFLFLSPSLRHTFGVWDGNPDENSRHSGEKSISQLSNGRFPHLWGWQTHAARNRLYTLTAAWTTVAKQYFSPSTGSWKDAITQTEIPYVTVGSCRGKHDNRWYFAFVRLTHTVANNTSRAHLKSAEWAAAFRCTVHLST